jgi:hypothetical protein
VFFSRVLSPYSRRLLRLNIVANPRAVIDELYRNLISAKNLILELARMLDIALALLAQASCLGFILFEPG